VQIRQRCEDVFDTGKSCEFEVTVPTPTGRRYFSVRFFPELDLNGSVINVLGIARDFTKRKVAEEELKKEKEVLRKIFDNIPVMIGFVGTDDRVKLVNPEWERTMGWTLKELQEQDVDIFAEAYPDLSYRQEVLDFVAAAAGQWVDLNIRVRDGRVIDAACAVVHLSDGTKVAIAQDITERKQAEEQLKATTEQLRALSASLRSAREEEGIRIARELHDELGAGLSSLKWDLEEVFEVVSQSTAPPHIAGLRKRIEAMIELTDTTVNAVRRIASELRPAALDELGLSEAIEWQARQFQERTGIIVRCDCDQEGVALSAERSTALFRIFQEALTNILRHAQATKVHIQLNIENDEFILTIADDGRGITDDEKSGQRTLGLLGMGERAHLVGGKVDITGSDGKGTLVTVRIPISAKTYSEASH
jgi:PAS domain S-box-containing protein